jgi:2-enoate reductase
MLHHLEKAGVRLMNCASLKRINASSVLVEQNISKTVPDPCNTWTPVFPENIANPFQKKLGDLVKAVEIDADMVIICTGAKPEDTLYHECIKLHTAPELHCLGDAFAVGRVLEAVRAGYALGCNN